jgi:putative protease
VISKQKINNRHNTILHQFPDFDDLKIAVKIAHEWGKRVFLTLNGVKVDLEGCRIQIKKAVECKVDGFIITDLILAKEIRNENPDAIIYLSVLVSAFNAASIKHYLCDGVKGLCLSRNLSLENIKRIIANLPPLEVAAFVSGNCTNTQTICRLHGMSENLPIYMNEGGVGELVCEGWGNLKGSKDASICSRLNQKDWCPLCQLRNLQEEGVSNLKIEGRSIDTLDKIMKVKYIKSALKHLEELSESEYIEYCKSAYYNKYGIRCNESNCYYKY